MQYLDHSELEAVSGGGELEPSIINEPAHPPHGGGGKNVDWRVVKPETPTLYA